MSILHVYNIGELHIKIYAHMYNFVKSVNTQHCFVYMLLMNGHWQYYGNHSLLEKKLQSHWRL